MFCPPCRQQYTSPATDGLQAAVAFTSAAVQFRSPPALPGACYARQARLSNSNVL